MSTCVAQKLGKPSLGLPNVFVWVHMFSLVGCFGSIVGSQFLCFPCFLVCIPPSQPHRPTMSHLHDPFSHLIPSVQPFGNFFGTSLSWLKASNDEASHSSPWQARPSDSTAARARRNMAKSHRKMMKHVGFTKRLRGWFEVVVPWFLRKQNLQVSRCKPFKFGVVKISLRFMGFMSAMLTKQIYLLMRPWFVSHTIMFIASSILHVCICNIIYILYIWICIYIYYV